MGSSLNQFGIWKVMFDFSDTTNESLPIDQYAIINDDNEFLPVDISWIGSGDDDNVVLVL